MSHESIEDLYARWQQNPDIAETTALCDALRGGVRLDLVDVVGPHAARQPEVGALLAAAKMYVDANRLEEAQGALITAGRIAPRDGNVYRWLGEVLLRRGDAERAEKVLEKAVQFGGDGDSGPLLEKARSFVPTQRSSGLAAVAESARDLLAQIAIPEIFESRPSIRGATMPVPPASGPPSFRGNTMPVPPPSSQRMIGKPPPPPAPPSSRRDVRPRRLDDEEDAETALRSTDDVKAAIEAALAPISDRGPLGRLPSARPPPMQKPSSVPPPPLRYNTGANKMPGELVFTGPTRNIGFDIQPTPARAPFPSETSEATSTPTQPRVTAAAATAAFDAPDSARAPVSAREPAREPPVNPMLLRAQARPAQGGRVPEPRDVLEALQVSGVYEPDAIAASAQVFTWSKPERTRRVFAMLALGTLALLLVGGGMGTYKVVTNSRAKDHVASEQLLVQIDNELRAGEPSHLEPIEKAIARSFELDSRSPHTSLTWLRERVLVGLLKGGADIAFEDAVQRARAVGIEEKRVAFAHVASFLFQNDIAGAAGIVAKWDSAAATDPWFQLVAGATFERAGDPRALERYSAAVKLDPELVVAQILLTRAMAVDGDARRAAELAKDFRARHPTRMEGSALVALVWTRDPMRGEPPVEVKDVTERGEGLPVALRAVPHAARAVQAMHRGAVDDARVSLQRGLAVVDTPGVAAWLGNIALLMGDENLARKAALAAVSFSAVYPPARVLAARVALLGARLDEALKATEDLPPTSPDVAVVTAAAAYEKLDTEHLGRALDAIGDDARKQPFALSLVRGQALLAGNVNVLTTEKAFEMADDEAPWSDLVAMDWALDSGDLDVAKKIAERWRGEPRAMHGVRLSRLGRYDGRLEDADRYSKIAIQSGTVTIRVLSERVFVLVAMKRDVEALALFRSYPNVGGPLAKWLRAYVTAVHGKVEDARAMVSQEDPPPPAAPIPARIIAACAFAAMKDMRHGPEYTRPIVVAGFANPDVGYATDKLGLGKIVRNHR